MVYRFWGATVGLNGPTPDFLPKNGSGILFLDELNAAPAMAQASCYQLVLDRKLGEYTLPEGWAIEAGIRPEVVAFLRFRPELLNAFDRDARAFPSPRSWEFVSHILDGKPDQSIEHEMFAGAVGADAATEFSAFLKMFRELPNIDAILLNPLSEPVPDNAAAQYAVASALARCASDINFDRVCAYLQRMPVEFRVLCVRDASLREPMIRHTSSYTKWAIENHHVLA